MVPRDGGAEEGGLKANLFDKKYCAVKGDRGGHFYVTKNIQISIIFTFKVPQ